VVEKWPTLPVGHNAILHACTIHDDAFVGMGATVMDGAVVEKGAMVAAGALAGLYK
jgi:carbonic anhydrase/acetyltransferase-like protein (isoleucine patch superfamily)